MNSYEKTKDLDNEVQTTEKLKPITQSIGDAGRDRRLKEKILIGGDVISSALFVGSYLFPASALFGLWPLGCLWLAGSTIYNTITSIRDVTKDGRKKWKAMTGWQKALFVSKLVFNTISFGILGMTGLHFVKNIANGVVGIISKCAKALNNTFSFIGNGILNLVGKISGVIKRATNFIGTGIRAISKSVSGLFSRVGNWFKIKSANFSQKFTNWYNGNAKVKFANCKSNSDILNTTRHIINIGPRNINSIADMKINSQNYKNNRAKNAAMLTVGGRLLFAAVPLDKNLNSYKLTGKFDADKMDGVGDFNKIDDVNNCLASGYDTVDPFYNPCESSIRKRKINLGIGIKQPKSRLTKTEDSNKVDKSKDGITWDVNKNGYGRLRLKNGKNIIKIPFNQSPKEYVSQYKDKEKALKNIEKSIKDRVKKISKQDADIICDALDIEQSDGKNWKKILKKNKEQIAKKLYQEIVKVM
ncbi:MAG: hypothetical protein LBC92_05750 [Rickettsiales bacterium]|jgi:hypothetical protein|nr:hypothetical protein [Rickettsiales bacterium]